MTCHGDALLPPFDTRPFEADTFRRGRKAASMEPDLVVVGGGAAGIGAARTAVHRGASVSLIESGPIGGDCTFTGCIPSKAVLEAAFGGRGFDQAMAAARQAIETVAQTESAAVLRAEGIEVIEGRARFIDRRTLDVDGTRVSGRAIVVATGAGPTVPSIQGIETVDFLTNENLFELTSLPTSMAVLGGGPIGVEMAEAFSRLGSRVTIIEGASQLLPREEPLAAHVLSGVFAKLGITALTGSPVEKVEKLHPGPGIRLTLSDGKTVESAALLVAVGRRPASGGLGLHDAGVEVDGRGFVCVDAQLRTTAKGVFAAGDVAEQLQFTHVAYQTGRIAAANALARVPLRRFDAANVPWVTFTHPEVARVGLTESQAVARGGRVAYLPMSEVDRAITAGRTEGFVKIITGPRPLLRNVAGGRILGATIVAPRAGEMLSELVLAMTTRMFPARVALTTHAYPTWSIAVQQATAQLFGEIGGRRSRPATLDGDDAEIRQRISDQADASIMEQR